MADTTNLADLPTDPGSGGSSGGDGQNIVIQATNNTSYNPNAGIQQSNNNGHDAINEQKKGA